MNKVAFFLTYDQIDALQALEVEDSPPEAVKRATWLALVKKRLVTLDPAPRLTPAGKAFNLFNRTLGVVNRLSGAEQEI